MSNRLIPWLSEITGGSKQSPTATNKNAHMREWRCCGEVVVIGGAQGLNLPELVDRHRRGVSLEFNLIQIVDSKHADVIEHVYDGRA